MPSYYMPLSTGLTGPARLPTGLNHQCGWSGQPFTDPITNMNVTAQVCRLTELSLPLIWWCWKGLFDRRRPSLRQCRIILALAGLDYSACGNRNFRLGEKAGRVHDAVVKNGFSQEVWAKGRRLIWPRSGRDDYFRRKRHLY